MIGEKLDQVDDDGIKKATVTVMEWAIRPETLTKLLGSMGSVLIASMFYSIWFIGPVISASAVTLGLLALPKLAAKQTDAFPSFSSAEKYAIVLSGCAAFLMTFVSPMLTATSLILASAGFGYYYIQDLVIAPLGVLNKNLLNLMRHWENTSQNQADLKALFLAGANPYLYIEKNELDKWVLKAEFEKLLPQFVERSSLLNCIEQNILKQDKNLTFIKTMKTMLQVFRKNMTLPQPQSDLAANQKPNAKALTNKLFNIAHTTLNALVKALQPFNTFLRTQAPNELFFENENGLSNVFDAGHARLAALLQKDGVNGAAAALGETLAKAGDAILHGANAAKTTNGTSSTTTDTPPVMDEDNANPPSLDNSSLDKPSIF